MGLVLEKSCWNGMEYMNGCLFLRPDSYLHLKCDSSELLVVVDMRILQSENIRCWVNLCQLDQRIWVVRLGL